MTPASLSGLSVTACLQKGTLFSDKGCCMGHFPQEYVYQIPGRPLLVERQAFLAAMGSSF